MKKKGEDKKWRRLNVLKRLEEGESAIDQTRHKAQEGSEEHEDAPVWWQMEVEGHSSNPRNRNRVRKFLQRKLDHLTRRTDLPEDKKRAMTKKLEMQLAYYQRPPRVEKQTFERRRRKRPTKHQAEVVPDGPSVRNVKRAVGHRLPPCRQGLIVHSAAVVCYRTRTRTRIARGRRYGVVSDGQKFHGLYHQAWMKEQARMRTQRARVHQQQEQAKHVPWNYDEQNKANAELMLSHPSTYCIDKQQVVVPRARVRPPEEGVLFNI